MFGSNNQTDNNSQANPAAPPPAADPAGAPAPVDNQQTPAADPGDLDIGGTELPPTRAASIEPPSPPPPLPDINSVDDQTQLEQAQHDAATHKAPDTSGAVSDDLMNIKQQALSQLSPLVSHLDQTPEEKFKTLMMMIQANDNKDLIKEAYAAAEQINDEKIKSQALLDIVNEINYFTQKKDNSNGSDSL